MRAEVMGNSSCPTNALASLPPATQQPEDTTALQDTTKPRVLVLTGPTAVGKTKISLTLAERLDGEIISADSVQVYKELDIGSDKILPHERRGIPHHLIDILSPEEEFSAGHFYEYARKKVAEILSRGKTPIVVGGTGFYLRWFICGKPSTPPASKESEEAANKTLDTAWNDASSTLKRPLTSDEKWEIGMKAIEELGDHESAKRLRGEMNNWYRLCRVVDILLQSPGKTLAQLDSDQKAPLDYDFRCYFLSRPRMELYRRIDARVEEMVSNGLVKEAGSVLMAQGLLANSNCATKAIGYRQALEFLEKGKNDKELLTETSMVQLVKDIQSASRKLCHRQLNWFRDDALFRWIEASERDEQDIVDEILRLWNKETHQGGAPEHGGRLDKEQKMEMKRYIAKIEKMVPGSKEIRQALQEARHVLDTISSDRCQLP